MQLMPAEGCPWSGLIWKPAKLKGTDGLSRILRWTLEVAVWVYVGVSVCVGGEGVAVSHLINIKAGEAINKWWVVVYMYFLTAPLCDVRQLPHTQVSWQRAKSRALLGNFELDLPIATSQRWRAV